MTYRDEGYDLRLLIQCEGCTLGDQHRQMIEEDVEVLRPLVTMFPVADLHLHIHQHPRTLDYHVTASLRLPKKVLFTGERHVALHAACQRCVRKLVKKVQAERARMARIEERNKTRQGRRQPLIADHKPDRRELEVALMDGDFVAFRKILMAFNDALHRRVGRWVERYPDLAARLGRDVVVSELVDEVYLTAWENWADRGSMSLGDWLETLVDPAMRRLLANPYAEKRLIHLVRQASA